MRKGAKVEEKVCEREEGGGREIREREDGEGDGAERARDGETDRE